jgi:hypothetical protein
MTESQWLACSNPEPMLEFLRGKVSDRKLRLFTCACCRRIWDLIDVPDCHKAIEVGELYVEGKADANWLACAYEDADLRYDDPDAEGPIDAKEASLYAVVPDAFEGAKSCVSCCGCAVDDFHSPEGANRRRSERVSQTALLRDIFGKPFRSSPPVPLAVLTWNDSTVRRIAEGIYEERRLPEGTLDGARLAILSDALLDAGCDNADLIAHLRSPGPHVRGCWAIDLLTGRE